MAKMKSGTPGRIGGTVFYTNKKGDQVKGTIRLDGLGKNGDMVQVVGKNGKSTMLYRDQLNTAAGRPVKKPVKATPGGGLPEDVARGKAPDSTGKTRKPIPEKVLNKLQNKGIIKGGGGGGGGDFIVQANNLNNLFSDYMLKDFNGGSRKKRRFSSGGVVTRKNSFKGTF